MILFVARESKQITLYCFCVLAIVWAASMPLIRQGRGATATGSTYQLQRSNNTNTHRNLQHINHKSKINNKSTRIPKKSKKIQENHPLIRFLLLNHRALHFFQPQHTSAPKPKQKKFRTSVVPGVCRIYLAGWD